MNKSPETSIGWPFIAALVGFWAWFHYRVLFGGNTFVLEDSSRFFFPLWKWGSEVWGKGWVPLWNADAGFGTPYLADPQMAAWYPPVYFFYRVFSPVTAFNLLICGHHLFGLLGFYYFARKKGFSNWAAFTGSFIFGFSFNTVSLTWASPMLFTYAWIPWIFTAVNRLKNNEKSSFLFLSFALAMQLAAGYPLFFYLTILTLLVEAVFEIKGLRIRAVALGFGAVFIAFLYNAAWLIPFREFISFSNLSERTAFSESLGWGDLASWLNPFFKGHPLYSHPEAPFSVTVYFAGLPLLVLMIWGIVSRKVKPASVLIFLVILVLSLGETAFLGGLLKGPVPGYSLLVRSGYWIPFVIWVALEVFLEAVAGLKAFEEKNPTPAIGFWMVSAFLVYGWALAVGVPWDLGSFWISFCFLLAVGLPRHLTPGFRQAFLALAIIFSLWPMAWNINFTMDRSYYEDKPPILLRMTLPGRLYQSSESVDALKTVSGKSVGDAYEKLKQSLLPNSPLGWGRDEVSFVNSLCMDSFLKWYLWTDHTDVRTAHKLLDFLNVRYRIGYLPFAHPELSESPEDPASLFENKTLLPKWFSTEKALPVPEGLDVGQYVLDPSFDLGKECFIADPSGTGDYQHRLVEETERTACSVHLEAPGKGRGLLVSSETDYPGWRAKVHGKDKPVELVNQAFRGIILSEGEDQVSLDYIPSSFRLGCFISLCVCGIWFGAILRILTGIEKHF
jgi:hypothetical protein